MVGSSRMMYGCTSVGTTNCLYSPIEFGERPSQGSSTTYSLSYCLASPLEQPFGSDERSTKVRSYDGKQARRTHSQTLSTSLPLALAHSLCTVYSGARGTLAKPRSQSKRTWYKCADYNNRKRGQPPGSMPLALQQGCAVLPGIFWWGPRTPRTAAQAQRHRVLRWRYEATASGAQLLLPAPKSS